MRFSSFLLSLAVGTALTTAVPAANPSPTQAPIKPAKTRTKSSTHSPTSSAGLLAVDINTARPSSFWTCLAKTHQKVVIKGYGQACKHVRSTILPEMRRSGWEPPPPFPPKQADLLDFGTPGRCRRQRLRQVLRGRQSGRDPPHRRLHVPLYVPHTPFATLPPLLSSSPPSPSLLTPKLSNTLFSFLPPS